MAEVSGMKPDLGTTEVPKPSSGNADFSVSSASEPPAEKICYVVQAGETMNAIAAKFDLTPSELARLNRIPTNSMLFPGRKLSIPMKRRRPQDTVLNDGQEDCQAPEKNSDPEIPTVPHRTEGSRSWSENDSQEQVFTTSQPTDLNNSASVKAEACPAKAGSSVPATGGTSGVPRARPSHVLKINARHITDGQGVVTGTLLITPNNIMFSPNVSDLIVIEHGTEHYEVTAPIDMIAGAALYTDIAIMRTKHHHRQQQAKSVVCNIPVQVYYSENCQPEAGSRRTDAKRDEAAGTQVAEGAPDASPLKHSTTTSAGQSGTPNKLVPDNSCGGRGQREERNSDSGSEPVSPRPTRTPPSSPIVGYGGPDDGNRRTDSDQPSGRATGRTSGSDIEEPDVFAALEKLLPKAAAQQQDNGMLYLCLRMGKPLNKVVKMSAVAVGRRKLKCEYWFGIPRNRVDEVYKFFQRNCPEKYGDVIELDMAQRGFEDIESDEDEDVAMELISSSHHHRHHHQGHHHGRAGESDQDGGSAGAHADDARAPEAAKSSTDGALTGVLNRVGSFKNPFKLPRFFEGPNTQHPSFSSCEWEVSALKDDQGQLAGGGTQLNPLTPDEMLLPEMIDESEILDEEHRRTLYKEIPARAEGYAWRLVYSTTRHGFSLKTFYREMARHDGPVLLAITDTEGALFGAFVSQSIVPSDHFYGTGEMFLWSFHPTFSKYAWSGDNQYFVKGNPDSLVFGSGDGEFGLYLDGDLYHGRSAPCKTFRNEVLSKTNDFVIKSLEAWGFF